MTVTVSVNGYSLIKSEEDVTLTVKNDVGHPMIGFGHDMLQGESYPNGITLDFAENLLCTDVRKWESVLNNFIARNLIPISVDQWEIDALADFMHECGITGTSQMLSHGWPNVPNQLSRWVYAHENGKPVELQDMVDRRRRERQLFVLGTTTLKDGTVLKY